MIYLLINDPRTVRFTYLRSGNDLSSYEERVIIRDLASISNENRCLNPNIAIVFASLTSCYREVMSADLDAYHDAS